MAKCLVVFTISLAVLFFVVGCPRAEIEPSPPALVEPAPAEHTPPAGGIDDADRPAPAEIEPETPEHVEAGPDEATLSNTEPKETPSAKTEPDESEIVRIEPDDAEPDMGITPQGDPDETSPVETVVAPVEPNVTEPNEIAPSAPEPESIEPNDVAPVVVEPNNIDANSIEPVIVEPNATEPAGTEPNEITVAVPEPNQADANDVEPPTVEPNDSEPPGTEPNEITAAVPEPNQADANDVEPITVEPNDVEPAAIEPNGVDANDVKPRVTDSNDVKPNPATAFHDKCAPFLKKYVDARGMVNYKALKRRMDELRALLAEFAKLDRKEYEAWPKEDKIALWINAYNIKMLDIIVRNYPIKPRSRFHLLLWGANDVRHIEGKWTKYKFLVMDEAFTLFEIDKRFFRKEFDDPRVLLAISNACLSSPPLRNEPYYGHKLDKQLDDQAKKFLASPLAFKIDRAKGKVYLFAYFMKSEYGKEFLKKYAIDRKFKGKAPETRAVLNFIINYVSAEVKSFLEVGNYTVQFMGYNWKINDGSK